MSRTNITTKEAGFHHANLPVSVTVFSINNLMYLKTSPSRAGSPVQCPVL